MELTGEHRIPAPRQKVWEALHDPAILKECIKGCQRLEKVDDHHLSATVQAKVGPVKATFDAKVEIQNEVPPERYTLAGEGKGGVAGFAKGSADVDLRDEGEETVLTYRADAQIGGKLAQIGSRLVETTAKKYAADFFETFSRIVGGGSPETGADEAAAPELADAVPGQASAGAVAASGAAAVPMPAASAGAPGTAAPGTGLPGTETPGAMAPGTGLPSTGTLGMGAPGTGVPGTGAPGMGVPGAGAPAATPGAAASRPAPSSPASPAPTSGWIGPVIWGGLAVVALIVAIFALT